MKSASPRLVRTAVLGLLLFSLTGCVTKSQDGDATVFRLSLWIPLAAAVAGLAATVLGWMMRRTQARLALALLSMGLLGMGYFAPGLAMDNVRVSPQGFRVETGPSWWFAREVQDVRFDDIAAMELATFERGSGRSKSQVPYLVYYLKKGGEGKVPSGGPLLANGALERILEAAKSKRIPFEDMRIP